MNERDFSEIESQSNVVSTHLLMNGLEYIDECPVVLFVSL